LLITVLALAANIAANIALVPAQGIVGAAIATFITEVIVTAGCVFYLLHHRVERSRRTVVANPRVEPT